MKKILHFLLWLAVMMGAGAAAFLMDHHFHIKWNGHGFGIVSEPQRSYSAK